MDKKNKHAGKGDTINMMLNVIIVIVILAVLGLAVWAVAPKVMQNWQERAQTQQEDASQDSAQTQQQTVTVAQKAESEGITVDEYKAKYGLGETVTGDTSFDEALYSMNLANFAAAQGLTVENVREQYSLPDSVADDTAWSEALMSAPAKAVVGGDEGFEQLKQQYGLTDVADDITWGDLMPKLQEKIAAQQAAASAEPSSDGAESAGDGAESADGSTNNADGAE